MLGPLAPAVLPLDLGRLIGESDDPAAVIGDGFPTSMPVTECLRQGRPQERRRSDLPDIHIVTCGAEQHRISLPSPGPMVLLDDRDRQLVEAMLAQRDGIEGGLLALRYSRGRASYNSCGWYKWGAHVSPSFGKAGSTIRDRLKELGRRRSLRRQLRDVDLK